MQHGIRGQQSITAWLDNCGSQGKNWIIYTALVSFMCSGLAELCTLRYFEKGHTFMSADSYHHSVEKAMKQKKNMHDFSDFIECLNLDGQAVILSHNDLFSDPKGLTKGRHTCNCPVIDQLKEVQFYKNFKTFQWKYDFKDEYETCEFLTTKNC